MTDRSLGIASPRAVAAEMTASAIPSLAAKIAVGRTSSASSPSVASRGRLRLEATFPDELRVEGDPCLLECVPVRGLPQSSRLEIGSPGDETDAPMAEPDQVLDGGDGAEKVLRIDRRERGRTDVVVDGDHRRAGRRIDAARCDEDDAVGERAADPREVAALPAGLVGLLPAAGEDDELEPRALDALGDPLEELGAERLDVTDEHADHIRAPAPQALTGEARVVPQLVDHRPDPRGGRLGNAVAVVDHLRHRRDGHTRMRRHVADRHASHGGR